MTQVRGSQSVQSRHGPHSAEPRVDPFRAACLLCAPTRSWGGGRNPVVSAEAGAAGAHGDKEATLTSVLAPRL